MGITTLAAALAVSLGFDTTILMFLIGSSACAEAAKTEGMSHSVQKESIFMVVGPRRKE
jgi:hypothetical protein